MLAELLTQYNRVVARSGVEGLTPNEARERALDAMERKIARGQMEPPTLSVRAQLAAKWDQVITSERRARRERIRHEVEEIANALTGQYGLKDKRDLLGKAFPTGAGVDKSLKFWSMEDWMDSVVARQVNAEKAAHAARVHAEHVSVITGAMRSRNALLTGDLF